MNLTGKTVLIFGGCGTRGSAFIHQLLADYGGMIRIVNFDNLSTGKLSNLDGIQGLVTGYYHHMDAFNPSDVAHVLEQELPDVVVDAIGDTDEVIRSVLADYRDVQYFQLSDFALTHGQ